MNMEVDASSEAGASYRAAVGPEKADFYAPKFLRFDEPGSSKISWNWPAFFVSFYWFLYRRMYAFWAIYCLLIPIVIAILGGIVGSIGGLRTGNSVYLLAILGYRYVYLPMFANSLYHRSVKAQLEKLRHKVPDRATRIAVLENSPHTNPIIWVIVPFIMIAMTGVLAAIAIPAYQEFTIRAQVAEGLSLSEPLKAAVSKRYAASGTWPVDLADLGMGRPPQGNHVASVTVDRGTLTIEYGNMANTLIAGYRLSLRPAIVGGDVVWTCGRKTAAGEDPAAPAAGPSTTNLSARYLPITCRADAR